MRGFSLKVPKMRFRKTCNFKLLTFNRFGFTLLELLVVLAIMSILTAMSIPAITGYIKGARLKGGARQINSALLMARQLAITKRTIYSVDFNPTARTFWVEYNDGGIDTNPDSYSGSTLIDEIRTLPETINFYTSVTYPMTYPYNFTARGTGTSGDIYIIDTKNNGKRITVTGATGNVKISDWSP